MSDQKRGRPVAFSFRKIALREGVQKEAFVKFMLEELFPTLDTSEGAFGADHPDQHLLLQGDWPSDIYVWMSRLEYGLGHEPRPQYLLGRLDVTYEVAKEKLEPFGTYTTDPREVYIDLAGAGGFAFI